MLGFMPARSESIKLIYFYRISLKKDKQTYLNSIEKKEEKKKNISNFSHILDSFSDTLYTG
jgi:hypothetical protein